MQMDVVVNSRLLKWVAVTVATKRPVAKVSTVSIAKDNVFIE